MRAQDTVRVAVTYVSSGTVYLDAGSDRGAAVGDTLRVPRPAGAGSTAVVTAISSRSAAARPLSTRDTIRQGEQGILLAHGERRIEQPGPAPRVSAAQWQDSSRISTPVRPSAGTGSRTFRGRIALQYAGSGMEGIRQDFSVSSLIFQLQTERLPGTDLMLSLNGRASYDAGPSPFATGSHYQLRLYEAALGYEKADAWYGWSIGRIASRFVGGLGSVDGIQSYARSGNFTAGVLAGWQPDWQTSGLDTKEQKGALFVAATAGGDKARWDAAAAYAGQWHEGRLDRDFLYLQNTLRLFQTTYLYQSSEIDLHVVSAGIRTGTFRLSNTFVTLSTYPVSWLNASLSYDATRPIYLFESMRWLPDSLLDFSIRWGYRASLGIRLPLGLIANAWGRYAPGSGLERSTAAAGGGLRASDILRSGVNAGVQYSSSRTLYTSARTVSADLDDWLFSTVSVQVHAERSWYSLRYWDESQTATTLSGSANLRLWGRWYAMASGEQLWEEQGNVRRVFLELGVRF